MQSRAVVNSVTGRQLSQPPSAQWDAWVMVTEHHTGHSSLHRQPGAKVLERGQDARRGEVSLAYQHDQGAVGSAEGSSRLIVGGAGRESQSGRNGTRVNGASPGFTPVSPHCAPSPITNSVHALSLAVLSSHSTSFIFSSHLKHSTASASPQAGFSFVLGQTHAGPDLAWRSRVPHHTDMATSNTKHRDRGRHPTCWSVHRLDSVR